MPCHSMEGSEKRGRIRKIHKNNLINIYKWIYKNSRPTVPSVGRLFDALDLLIAFTLDLPLFYIGKPDALDLLIASALDLPLFYIGNPPIAAN